MGEGLRKRPRGLGTVQVVRYPLTAEAESDRLVVSNVEALESSPRRDRRREMRKVLRGRSSAVLLLETDETRFRRRHGEILGRESASGRLVTENGSRDALVGVPVLDVERVED